MAERGLGCLKQRFVDFDFFHQNSLPRTGTTTPGLYIPDTTVLNHNARPAQLSPAIYSSAAQRSATRCRAVRCPALPCAAVLCHAALSFFEYTAVPGIRVVYSSFCAQQRSAAPCGAVSCPALRCCVMLRCAFFRTYSSTRYTCCVLVFLLFLQLISLGHHFFPHANYTTADQNVTPLTSTQRSTGQFSSAQTSLGIINSLFAPNYGPLLSAPFTCFNCILPCASVAGGVWTVEHQSVLCW